MKIQVIGSGIAASLLSGFASFAPLAPYRAVAEPGTSPAQPAKPDMLQPGKVAPAAPGAPVKPTNPDIGPTSPPEALSRPAKTVAPATAAKPKTIVDIAGGENFTTLATALKAAGLVDALANDGPFTVFAPTNAAFAALPEGLLDKLLLPENKSTLIQLLSYHVVPGTVMAKDLKNGPVKTTEGSAVTVKLNAGKVMVNEAKVTTADVKAANGVVHVVDQVILPPMTASNAPAAPAAAQPAAKPVIKPGAKPAIKPSTER